jgi:hypothetical protein
MGNSALEQADYGAGMYRGRRPIEGSVYDAVNALVNDDGLLYKRGGSSYKSNADSGTKLVGLVDRQFYAGQRTVAWNEHTGANLGDAYVLASDDATPATHLLKFLRPFARPSMVHGIATFMYTDNNPSNPNLVHYAGSRKVATGGGTATITAGSRAVTGSGSTFSTHADRGSFLQVGTANGYYVVDTIASNTALTLRDPAPLSATGNANFHAFPTRTITDYPGSFAVPNSAAYTVRAVGSAGRRSLVAINEIIRFSDIDDPLTFQETSYHEIPDFALPIGIEGVGDTGVIFTTAGVWAIQNLTFDPVDDVGNVQHIVSRMNELILWDESGIAQYQGMVLVPAIDDVWLMPVGTGESPKSLTDNIRPLYRDYVKSGYRPGLAAVHRGHYFLPIVNGTSLVDVLVCRLDRGAAWTRWAGHAAGGAYAQRIGADTRQPKLLGISGARITEVTASMALTGAAQDADATTPVFRVDENDIDLGGGIRPNTAEKVRYVYETTGGTPTVTVSSATGPEGASYSAGTLKRGGGASDGTDYTAVRIGRKAERIRFRFECSSQVTSLLLRRREVVVRQAAQN